MKNEMYAYLQVEGFKKDPDFITNLLRVKPTSVSRIGDSIEKTVLKSKLNSWEYRIDARDNFDLEFLVRKIFAKFKDKKNLKKALSYGKATVVCVLYAVDTDPSLELSTKLISEMASLKCGLWIDFYPMNE